MAMKPAIHSVGFMIQVETNDEVLQVKPCIVCGHSDHVEGTLDCDMCRNVAHVDCLGLILVLPGFWYCPACCECIVKGEVQDCTMD